MEIFFKKAFYSDTKKMKYVNLLLTEENTTLAVKKVFMRFLGDILRIGTIKNYMDMTTA